MPPLPIASKMTHANDLMPKDGMRWAGLPDLDLDSSSYISCLDGSIVTCFLFLGLRESNLLSLSVGQISSVQRKSKKFEAEVLTYENGIYSNQTKFVVR